MYNPGDTVGPYEIINAGPRGESFVVECRKCGAITMKTIRSLRVSKEKDECTSCKNSKETNSENKPAMTSEIKVYDPVKDIVIIKDELAELRETIKKTGTALNKRVDMLEISSLDDGVNACYRKARSLFVMLSSQKSKEIVFTEMFAMLGMRFSSGSINERTYLDRVALLMRMVESIPAAWWHARRERKMGEWMSVLTKAGVEAAIAEGLNEVEVDSELFE